MTQTYTQVAQEHIRLQAERKALIDETEDDYSIRDRLKEIDNRIDELESMLKEWGVL